MVLTSEKKEIGNAGRVTTLAGHSSGWLAAQFGLSCGAVNSVLAGALVQSRILCLLNVVPKGGFKAVRL